MKSKFLRRGMVCLYLDQLVLSRMCEAPVPVEWEGVGKLIYAAHDQKKVLCPRSLEHFIESSAMEARQARELNRKLSLLGFGWIMRNEVQVACRQLIAAGRGRSMTRGDYLARSNARTEISDNKAQALRGLKDHAFDAIQRPVDLVNVIRDAARDGTRRSPKSDQAVLARTKSHYIDALLVQFKRISRGEGMSLEFVGDEHMQFPRWDVTICSLLKNQFRLNRREARKLVSLIEERGLDVVPALDIRATFEALQATKQAKIRRSDQLDIMRLSSAVPLADVVVTDGARAHDLKEAGLDKKYRTMVFSGKTHDRRRLEDLLRGLLNRQELK